MKLKGLLDGHALKLTLCYCSVLEECWATSYPRTSKAKKSAPEDDGPIAATEEFDE